MAEYKLGDQTALEEIFQRYKRPILNYAYRLLNNRADAEDAVGDVFCALASRKSDYKPRAKFSTWLYTIAHNICISRIRKKRRVIFMWFKRDKDAEEYESWDVVDAKSFPDALIEAKDTAQYVRRAISKLSFAQREALILREYHNLSYEEISNVLKTNVSRVRILIFRARRKLKKILLPLIEEAG